MRDPERNIARATLIGTAVAAVVYVLGTMAVMGILPPDILATSCAPFADAANQIWGGWAGDAVAIGAIVSTFGCLNGWILLQGQMPYAAARDGLFPAAFKRLNKYGVPGFGIVVSTVLLTIFMLPDLQQQHGDRFTDFILLATTTTLIAYIYGASAQLMLIVQEPGEVRRRSRRPRDGHRAARLGVRRVGALRRGLPVNGVGGDAGHGRHPVLRVAEGAGGEGAPGAGCVARTAARRTAPSGLRPSRTTARR